MPKQRLTTLTLFACIMFLCASLGIPNSDSLASSARDEFVRTSNMPSNMSSSTPVITSSVPDTAMISTTFLTFTQEWQAILYKIDQARDYGKLTIDEAARLRFTALSDPASLPTEFHLTQEERNSLMDAPPVAYPAGTYIADFGDVRTN